AAPARAAQRPSIQQKYPNDEGCLEAAAGRSCFSYPSKALIIIGMLSPSLFTPQAWQDALEITAYIGTDNPEAASRFVPALEATCAQLALLPGMGSARTFQRIVHPLPANLHIARTPKPMRVNKPAFALLHHRGAH